MYICNQEFNYANWVDIKCKGSLQYNGAHHWQQGSAYKKCNYSTILLKLSEQLTKTQKSVSIARKTFVFTNNHWRLGALIAPCQLRDVLS
jgi:hypothetical protein